MYNNIEVQYVNMKYPKKKTDGFGFAAFWVGMYLSLTVISCAWMWFAR